MNDAQHGSAGGIRRETLAGDGQRSLMRRDRPIPTGGRGYAHRLRVWIKDVAGLLMYALTSLIGSLAFVLLRRVHAFAQVFQRPVPKTRACPATGREA